MERYPARWIGIVMAVVGVLGAFGVYSFTPEQVGAVEAFLLALFAVLPIVQGLFTERKVYSPRTHQAEVQRANEWGKGGYSSPQGPSGQGPSAEAQGA